MPATTLPRRLLGGVVTVALAVAIAVAVVRLATSDDPTAATSPAAGPLATAPDRGAAPLTAGNAVVTVPDAADARTVRRVARDLGAPDTPALRAAGQAVLVRTDRSRDDVTARIGDRVLRVRAADDPRLRTFLEQGLGG
ncbi:MAG: hypothetical protein M0P31_07110 [Solirubrobacteraceae bacterium]|nr:hypothetical protein [Solirubrobacteraceae bacterium]